MMSTAQSIVAALAMMLHGAPAVLGTVPQEGAAAQSSPAKTPPSPTPALPAADADYTLGIDDVLAISVWRENDLTRSVQVRADGKITFPLAGQVQAAGLTCQQLQQRLTELLRRDLRSPEVSVSVQEARSQRINVLGMVTRPGMYPLQKPMTVLDALALAGGFRPFAKTRKIFVLRTGPDGQTERIPFDYRKAVLKDGKAPPLELRARDTVVVP